MLWYVCDRQVRKNSSQVSDLALNLKTMIRFGDMPMRLSLIFSCNFFIQNFIMISGSAAEFATVLYYFLSTGQITLLFVFFNR